MIDRESASRVSPQIQDLLFAMAVSNSCMNPLVYGSYALRLSGTVQRLLKSSCCWASPTTDTAGKLASLLTMMYICWGCVKHLLARIGIKIDPYAVTKYGMTHSAVMPALQHCINLFIL
ncbi:jg4489 [Pararge aegeria aegeria]|uniref:Jg4489 protein n=1 Tax=Pararge aegeria aegeria TaxID=348720 RepID=A0A8S4R1K1_9NEOP|nr:jg4489 [Pararge aegeria aegeria]